MADYSDDTAQREKNAHHYLTWRPHRLGCACTDCTEARYQGPLHNLQCLLGRLIANTEPITDEDRRQRLLTLESRFEREASIAQGKKDLPPLIELLRGLVGTREELYLLEKEPTRKFARKLRRAKDRLAEAERAFYGPAAGLLRAIRKVA
jgi:hypothetical protein